MSDAPQVHPVGREDLDELLPLVRDYLDFYEVSPPEADVRVLCETLLARPEYEGAQFLARDAQGTAIGFATVFWSWSTTRACRIGTMNDLFVTPSGRGAGAADALIVACREACTARGAKVLEWMTAKDNARAQAVYDRVGAMRSEWVSYKLLVPVP